MIHKATVLVAEDEKQARLSLAALLEDEGYRVIQASDGHEASRLFSQCAPEAALLDIRMPGKDGLALLRELRASPHPPAVLIMTAYGNSTVAIEAMTLGAFDYIAKPVNFSELLIQLERAIGNRRRIRELEIYRAEEPPEPEPEIIGSGPAMQRVYKQIGQVAPSDSTVLLRGESGTGKELAARAIHRHSPRAARRLVKVNCAAIPEALLEAELFGHERGAFTGAAQRRIGKFEFADGGTIFLDEIGEISPAIQAKLLRFLQERTIERLGSNASIKLDVRVISATNRDLEAAVRESTFREDLYYRLNVVSIALPSLRERREDIEELAQSLLRRCAARLKLVPPALSPQAAQLLTSRNWPGNVRELEHCLERALIVSRGGVILRDHIEQPVPASTPGAFDSVVLEDGFHANVALLERWMIRRALERSTGNRTKAAELLRINRRLLYDKLREFGLD